ncbi:hypothetical protein LTS08_006202 [Lithohypha guttulata]|nr:hypothetical protein LTS08_006202 [Lithohypha guttulata]
MAVQRVLICGSGIAGTILAYWLGKHGFDVVVLERSRSESQQGQIIDVEGPAQEVVKKMGLLDQLKAKTTHEAGLSFVDSSNTTFASIPAGATNVSNEIEIMRPALVSTLLDAAASFPNVSVRYGCTVSNLEQTSSNVKATIEHVQSSGARTTTETFDIIVAADGLRSKTRDLILPTQIAKSCVVSIKAFCAFFSIPVEPQDQPNARFYSMSGRRGALIKPLNDKSSSAYMTQAKFGQDLHIAQKSRDSQQQKEVMASRFRGQGWECDRLVDAMFKADNFYFEELSQVYLDKWSYGRCALLGDTAYAPSPLTGEGTNLAIVGAYILAWALVQHAKEDSPDAAFVDYEKRFRPYVDKTQPIPLGGYLPLLVNPDTTWGIWILRTLLSWVCWLQVWKYIPVLQKKSFELPEM